MSKILSWLIGTIFTTKLITIVFIGLNDIKADNIGKVISNYDIEKGYFQLLMKKVHNLNRVDSLNGYDGPYIIGDKLYTVTKNNELQNRIINRSDSFLVKVDNEDSDQFFFTLKDHIVSESDTYKMPKKLIVMSDIEGNFNAFSSFLINNGVIDKNFNWTFGNGHLLLNGDIVDRGKNVTQTLWLIYKLENQALRRNGKVHYILGNHEIMNFQGIAQYANKKYQNVAKFISKTDDIETATQFMYSDKTELGKWLRSKNVIEKIGSYLFAHGGLHPDILKYKVSVSDINKIAKNNWDKPIYEDDDNNKIENFITGVNGIYWYRGLAIKYHYPKITASELDKILAFYKAKKIVFAHTINIDITKDFEGKLINTDVVHGKEKNSPKTKGLLIKNGIEYKIDGKGTVIQL